MEETTRDLRERLEKAKGFLAADARVHAKFWAVGALVRLGHDRDGARKLSADLAIERAEKRLVKRERTIHLGDHYDDVCGPYCPAINTEEEWTAAWRRKVRRLG